MLVSYIHFLSKIFFCDKMDFRLLYFDVAIVLLSVCTIGNFDGSLAFNSKGPIKFVSLINHAKLNQQLLI